MYVHSVVVICSRTQVNARHLNMQEEGDFVQQVDKILHYAASKDKTKPVSDDQPPQETKTTKDPQVATTTDSAKTTPTTPRAYKGSPSEKLPPATTSATEEGVPRSDTTAGNGTRAAKVVNKVTGELHTLPPTSTEPTADQAPSRSEAERQRDRERENEWPAESPATSAVGSRPAMRDVATGMTPASSGILLGSQGCGEETGSRRGGPSPPLSSQTSTEVSSPVHTFFLVAVHLARQVCVCVCVYCEPSCVVCLHRA